jgi:mRNA-degrading endonuclease RelE of RelBE toxin-antitoxin system
LRFIVTERFSRAYHDLPDELQRKADKALRLLQENPKHPSLRIKKIQGTSGIWEARVDRSCRITLEMRSDSFLLRNIGKHDEALGNP